MMSITRFDRCVVHLSIGIICFVASGQGSCAETSNPYAHAREGDWAKYETLSQDGFGSNQGEVYQFVTKANGKSVRLSSRSKRDVASEFLSADIDPTEPLSFEDQTGYFEPKPMLRFSVNGSGTDTLRVGDRDVSTKWTSYEARSTQGLSSIKIWRADDIGIGGIVKKVHVNKNLASVWTETLVDFGNGDKSAMKNIVEAQPNSGVEKEWTNSLGMKFVRQKAGSFIMGALPRFSFYAEANKVSSPTDRLDLLSMRPPQTSAMIDQDFWMGAAEVTISEFQKFVQHTGYETESQRNDVGGTGLTQTNEFTNSSDFTWEHYGFEVSESHPVANVSFNDAVAFCEWLSKKEGVTYRLPSETEWEFACRAGTTETFTTGDSLATLNGHANVADQSLARKFSQMQWAVSHDDGFAFTAPVGSFKPNSGGLYDMHGNVLEWTGTKFWFFEPLEDAGLPPATEFQYTVRGGNWFNQPDRAGSACRIGMPPSMANSLTGFRVVVERD